MGAPVGFEGNVGRVGPVVGDVGVVGSVGKVVVSDVVVGVVGSVVVVVVSMGISVFVSVNPNKGGTKELKSCTVIQKLSFTIFLDYTTVNAPSITIFEPDVYVEASDNK